ncbi:hypothetical protein [Allocoleopsis franciscana]|uniref:Uncharacterized protein n=1 Tax=Allocoleopsis franciscana PCC 7113 TaxID=1173027 RepID=K9WKD1_9CYAN|nr:hypothetical protein [Allocoleopsis franciscana]AFZ20875.1 hypothetical protein Mic7113_5225 [Allocoleopsis franciscana PCC 7113]
MRWLHSRVWVALAVALSATPAFSQANFGKLKLSSGFSPSAGQASGRTGGTYSLSSIANSDRQKKPCIGYGSETPDHIMVLESNFPKLAVEVNSGKDTTLVIRGPNNLILCGDDTKTSKDASVEAANLPPGEYSVWVGTLKAGQRWNYTLTVRQ